MIGLIAGHWELSPRFVHMGRHVWWRRSIDPLLVLAAFDAEVR